MSATTEERTRTQQPVQGKGTAMSGDRKNPALRGPVLLATRGSGDSPAALSVAQLIATAMNRKLNLLSVVEPAIYYGLPPEMQLGAIAMDEEGREARHADLKDRFAQHMIPGLSWSADVRVGQPALEVCDAAKSLDASMIVVGASPHRRLRRIVAGQRAAQILHRSGSPVLSVAPWLRTLPKNVVAAIDFNAPSLRAAEAALLMMEKGGSLTLVHVIPANFIYPSPNPTGDVLRSSIQQELDKITVMLKGQVSQPVSMKTAVLDGDPATEVLTFAEQHDADLIAVGTGGGSAFRRALVGSVATEIFHSALCSVLASPPQTTADQMRLDLELRGTATATDPKEFGAILHAFSIRNNGKRVSLEEDDTVFGAQIQAHGYQLRGVTFDKADKRVEIMLSAPGGEGAHLTRSIPAVTSVAVTGGARGANSALQIRHGEAQTLVLIDVAR